MRILIVDDETEFLDILHARLGKRGFSVVVADSGDKAMDLISKETFDAVVLDVKMPGKDGLETLRDIKKASPELPVLLLSGHASTDAAISGVESGAVDYLLKPVPLNDLISRLREIVSRKM